MPHKVGAYIRVSTEEQASAIEGSLQNQQYRLKSYIDAKNMQEKSWGKIIDFYIDDGYSAKDTNRPAYQRMMLDLKNKKIDLILVPDLSRLSRNLLDFCGLLDFLEKYKASFLSIKEQFDTSSSIGRMMVYQIITLAQFEREQTSERVALGVHARGMRGLLNGGRPILGYDKDPSKPGTYVINEIEAVKVRKIFQTYIESGSRAKTILKLQEIGIAPKVNAHFKKQRQSGEWTLDLLGILLSNATYIGCHEVNKKKKHLDQETLKPNQKYQAVKASWPAIVDEELYYTVQDQLAAAKKLERTRLKDAKIRLYILSGIFKCAECGQSLVGQSYHGENAVYKYYGHTTLGAKNGCKVQRICADEVESVVLNHLKENLVKAGYFDRIKNKIKEYTKKTVSGSSSEISRINDELQILEQETTNIFRIQAQGSFGSEALRMMSERLENIAKKRNQLTEHLKLTETKVAESIDASESAEYIKEKFIDFENGFHKSTDNQKKRLIRKTIKQLVLTKDKLAVWFYLNEDDEKTSGHKLKLVRDEDSEVGFSLVSGDHFSVSKQSGGSLDIGGLGDSGSIRTNDPLLRREMLYPTELRNLFVF